MEDTSGKGEAIAFPKTYSKIAEHLVEDKILIIDGILERRMGDMQIVIRSAEGMTIEELQERAKKEGLWTENEKIIKVSREEIEEEEVGEAEEILEVSPESVKELATDSLFENKGAHQVVINRAVDREFFEKLKALFQECPGKDEVEIVIGEKVMPVSVRVNWEGCLKEKVNVLLNG